MKLLRVLHVPGAWAIKWASACTALCMGLLSPRRTALLHAGASTAASVDGHLVQGAVYWVIDPAAMSQAYAPAIINQG